MANTFKSHGELNVGTGYVDMYAPGNGVTTVILGLALCNKSANAVTVSVQWQDTDSHGTAGEDYGLLETVSIPGRTTLEVLAGQKYILNANDILRIKAGTADKIDATLGIMEIT
jgi:hypothetical protein